MSKKSEAAAALMNAHFHTQEEAEALIEKMFDAFEEIAEERSLARNTEPPAEDLPTEAPVLPEHAAMEADLAKAAEEVPAIDGEPVVPASGESEPPVADPHAES